MQARLSWFLDRSQDTRDLRAFDCTEPPFKRPPDYRVQYPARWEWDAQEYLRRSPTRDGGIRTLVGRDDAGIAAASVWRERDQGLVIDLLAMGVARRCRGLHLGDEVMDETLNEITGAAYARGYREVELRGLADDRNTASRQMLQRWDFEYAGPGEPGVSDYGRRLLIAI